MNELQPVTLGDEPADLVIRNGRVLLPELCEFQARDVVVKNNRVAALPEDGTDAIGDETRVINASDRVVTPGFIDAHTHIDLHQTFENAYHYALEGGTTTVVSEVSGFGLSFGAEASSSCSPRRRTSRFGCTRRFRRNRSSIRSNPHAGTRNRSPTSSVTPASSASARPTGFTPSSGHPDRGPVRARPHRGQNRQRPRCWLFGGETPSVRDRRRRRPRVDHGRGHHRSRRERYPRRRPLWLDS